MKPKPVPEPSRLSERAVPVSIDETPLQLALRRDEIRGLPKYLALRGALEEEIAQGRWQPGQQIPAEDELARIAALSLGTVQRSLRMLVEEGRLVRRHGSGTFVAPTGAQMRAPFRHFQFVDRSSGQLLPLYTRTLSLEPVAGSGPWTEVLGESDVHCIDRVFKMGDEFHLYVHFYFLGRRFPELAAMPKDRLDGVNLKDLLATRYAAPATRYVERLNVCQFPARICRAIDIKRGTSGAVIDLTAYDKRGEALYFQRVFIPPNESTLLLGP